MKALAWSSLVVCVSLGTAGSAAAQTPVGALALDERQGDQYGWAVDYETAAAARAAAMRVDRRVRHSAPEQTCAGQPAGVACWMEISQQPGCYVWNPNPQADETMTWTGDCTGGFAQGMGTLMWDVPDGRWQTETGRKTVGSRWSSAPAPTPTAGRLPNPEHDATDISSALRRRGFEVTTERDADRVELTVALRAFTPRNPGADVSLCSTRATASRWTAVRFCFNKRLYHVESLLQCGVLSRVGTGSVRRGGGRGRDAT